MIIEKWKNIRDAFNTFLKKTTGDSSKNKYLYHDNLLFMLSISQRDNTKSSLAEDTSLVTEDDGASEKTQTEGIIRSWKANELNSERKKPRHWLMLMLIEP
ncbi:hypothetical protein JTB14_026255 [Gonioctena quinquepunctata]|nr:hypothetical protein JTB14_026255 [Gonioctena quinquepunctata]